MKNTISRRHFLTSAAAFAAGTGSALAQNFPTFPPPFGGQERYPTDRPPANVDQRGYQQNPQAGPNPNTQQAPIPQGPNDRAAIEQWYLPDSIPDSQFPIRKVRQEMLNPEFRRQLVPFRHAEQPGTLVVDAKNYYLYLLREGGQAIRYGVGVGREGFGWSGNAHVGRVAEWPAWVPPKEMRLRQPELPERMAGGYDNPLGARALYLYEGNKDTLYRIHGTAEPWTIGTNVSSGCIRLLNEEIADLYLRTPVGTKVVVIGNQQNIPVQSNQPAPQQIQPQQYQQQQPQYQQQPQQRYQSNQPGPQQIQPQQYQQQQYQQQQYQQQQYQQQQYQQQQYQQQQYQQQQYQQQQYQQQQYQQQQYQQQQYQQQQYQQQQYQQQQSAPPLPPPTQLR
jgi:lipoprotein-anchoring transpeptidase ErfK/SrfK